jgi:hypothetical protein
MAVEFPIPVELLVIGLPLLGGSLLAAVVAPRLVSSLRQRAYDRATARDWARWILRVDPQASYDRDAASRLIAGLHPGLRRGTSRWAVGWPEVILSVTWADAAATWEVTAPRQLSRVVEAAVLAAYPDAQLERAVPRQLPAANGRMGLSGAPPDPGPERRPPPLTAQLVELMAGLPADSTCRWSIRLRPLPLASSASPLGGHSFASELVAALLNQPMRVRQEPLGVARPRSAHRFAASVALEVWLAPTNERAWLFDATTLIGLLQSGGWRVSGRLGRLPEPIVAEHEAIAELWSPPGRGDEGRAVDVMRSRRLDAPPTMLTYGRPIALQDSLPLRLPVDLLLRHSAFIGRTGSGKSTQLLGMAADDLAAGRGFTFLDPHGDAVARLIDAVPAGRIERVHLIELAERERPRAFNFLELDGADPERVAVQFVDTLADLYPRYSGPKQTHYLRMALLTLLSRPPSAAGPWTVIDLYQLLVNRDMRRPFVVHLTDELLREFWEHEWPLDRRSAREPSVEAVLNKLGGFVTYPSIRDIVAARHSTIRPRELIDRGEVLLVDLSRVGRDNARLFGSMLVARYYVDALARQETAVARRVPHLLYIDEVHNFDTRALRGILNEGRKFGLGLVMATQYLGALQPELAEALRTNVATLGILQPSVDDSKQLAELFAPLTARDLLNLPRFRMALRTEVAGERVLLTPDVLAEPPRLGVAAAVRRSSDDRDAWTPLL